MPSGGKRSTSWAKGSSPVKKKGQIHTKTKLAKAAGVESWADLSAWIEGPGIKRYVEELKKLKGVQFNQGMLNIAEFVKPKLSRTEVLADIKTDIHWNETKKYGTGTKAEPGA